MMTNKKLNRKYRNIIFVMIGIMVLMLTACNWGGNNGAPLTEIEDPLVEVIELDPVYAKISAVGDVMMHLTQITAYHNKVDNTYDFTQNFSRIAPYIKEADIAIANLETTFGGEKRGFSGYPMFNCPDEMADALKWAGFNVISTANNHTMDTGMSGMLRTVEVLKDRELEVIGTKTSIENESYIIKEVNGILIGITSYTYETPRFGELKTLNGIKVPKEAEDLIDSFSYENLEEDLLKMRDRINLMKDNGAEAIIFYIHWGNEYQRKPNDYQRTIAQKLSNYGADVIFGSHPHVLQPIEIFESEESEKKTLVVYSLGNFLSNQRYETLSNRYTEDGMMVTVEFKKDLNNNEVSLNNVYYMPTWVYRYSEGGRLRYEILPVLEIIENEERSLEFSKDTIWRIINSKSNILELLELEKYSIKNHPIIQ